MYWQFETVVLLPMMLVLTAFSLGAVAGALHLLRLLPEWKLPRCFDSCRRALPMADPTGADKSWEQRQRCRGFRMATKAKAASSRSGTTAASGAESVDESDDSITEKCRQRAVAQLTARLDECESYHDYTGAGEIHRSLQEWKTKDLKDAGVRDKVLSRHQREKQLAERAKQNEKHEERRAKDAKALRDARKKQLKQLETKMAAAVQQQDYPTARVLFEELQVLRTKPLLPVCRCRIDARHDEAMGG
jgi:hypothetical protein